MMKVCTILIVGLLSALLWLPVTSSYAQEAEVVPASGVSADSALGAMLESVDEVPSAQQAGQETQAQGDKKTVAESGKLWKYGSVMYEDKYMGWVREAINSHEKNIPLEILLPDVFPPAVKVVEQTEKPADAVPEQVAAPAEPVVEKPKEAPVFYLKSIMYFAPDQWTIWLNDQKISTGETYPGLDIIKVTPREVVLVWKETKLDYIYPNWKQQFSAIGGSKFVSNRKNMVVDTETGNVSFILGHNQSFVTADMNFVEGKAEATSLDGEAAKDPASVEVSDDPASSSGVVASDKAANGKGKPANLIIPTGSDINSEALDRYVNQLNMLQSVLGPSSAAAPVDVPAGN